MILVLVRLVLFQWNAGRADRMMMAAVPDWQTNWQGQIDYALGEDVVQDVLVHSSLQQVMLHMIG